VTTAEPTTTTATHADDVIAQVGAQLRERLTLIQGQIARLDALRREAARIERALGNLTDDDAPAVTAGPALPASLPPVVVEPTRTRRTTRQRLVDAIGGTTPTDSTNGNGRGRGKTTGKVRRRAHTVTIKDVVIEVLRDDGPMSSGDLIARVHSHLADANDPRAGGGTVKQTVYSTLSAGAEFKRNGGGLWQLTRKAG